LTFRSFPYGCSTITMPGSAFKTLRNVRLAAPNNSLRHTGLASKIGHNSAGNVKVICRCVTLNIRLVNCCAHSSAYTLPHELHTQLLQLKQTRTVSPQCRQI